MLRGRNRLHARGISCVKSGFLSGSNLNKTHSNPPESWKEAGGIKAEGNCAVKFMTGIKLISITSPLLFSSSLPALLCPIFYLL